jgi:hypothetical protein
MAEPIRITWRMSGRIAALARSLGPEDRRTLNESAARQLRTDIRAHLRSEASRRHGTAQRLGAQPTGHLEKAAQSTGWSADAEAATVTVSSPGITRVFHPLKIEPKRARKLTIPVHALGYGRPASEVSAAHRLFRPKGKDYLMAKIDGRPTVVYLLRKAVMVPQDRSLLPSDEALGASARKGYRDGILLAMEEAAKAPMGPEVGR